MESQIGSGAALGMNAAGYVLGGLAVAGPAKPAIVCGDDSVTHGELAVRVARFATALREAGLNPGDRVALLMRDHADHVACYLAVIAAGGIAIAVSTRATSEDLHRTLAIVRPFAVVTESEFAPALTVALAGNERLLLRERELKSWLDKRSETQLVRVVLRPDDPAFWVMTSGTTGEPKAVEHRHDNVAACTDYLVHGLGATSADRFFPTSRLNFAYALGAMFGALRLGATLILDESWPSPTTIASTVGRHRPSIVLSVPTLYHKLCEAGLAQEDAFRRVRCYVSAGERLAPRIATEWEETAGRPIIDAMSCSELVHKIFTNTLSARRAGSSGRPVTGVEVRLIDRDGREITQPDRSGRLEVRARFLCAGYRLGDALPEAPAHRPAERFRGDWFATGDEYLRDEDGFYHHCGRGDDMLKVASLWVSPTEVEDALAGIPTIAEAAAVSSESDAGLSQIILYLVAARPDDGEAAIAAARAQLARALPAFKRPRRFELVAELPRTATGKIQRHKLRAQLQGIM
jgi:acyl-coenzyme A synthetase/AMP-(fatty) acid ligase